MLTKSQIVANIIDVLLQELDLASKAALESAQEATHEESRPENKYDTRGLETSYLASAQAGYAKDLKEALQAYRNLNLDDKPNSGPIAVGSVVTTLSPGGRQVFFIGPARGGLEIEDQSGTPLTVLTPKSPLGAQLIGKQLGNNAGPHKILRVE